MFTVKGNRNVINNKNALAHRDIWSWLIDHNVPWSEIDGQHGLHLVAKNLTWVTIIKNHASCPVLRLKPVPWLNGRLLSLRNDPAALLHVHIINLLPGLVQRDLHPFAKVAVHWKKRNIQTFQVLIDIASELMLITGDPKGYCVSHWRLLLVGDRWSLSLRWDQLVHTYILCFFLQFLNV